MRSRGGATEHEIQAALVDWAVYNSLRCRELALLHAIPNGARTSRSVANRLSREGMRAGVPDLFLPVARGGAHGLYLEMKSASGSVSLSQRWWHAALREQDYRVEVFRDWEPARDCLIEYLAHAR